VGTYDNGDPNNLVSHGFMLRNGVFTTIDFPGASSSTANGINNMGKIVGSYTECCGWHGFALARGKFDTVDDTDPNTTSTMIRGVNNLDKVVGAFATPLSFDPSGQAFQAKCAKVF